MGYERRRYTKLGRFGMMDVTFGICIESSNRRGMGHFFRMLQIVDYLRSNEYNYIVMINDDRASITLLHKYSILFEIVNLDDLETDWEGKCIDKYGIDIWLNDRMNTSYESCSNVKKKDIFLCAFDDLGRGQGLIDLNFFSLTFNEPQAFPQNVLKGVEYLILNKDIKLYQRVRKDIKRIIITLGGSDTYGLANRILNMISNIEYSKYQFCVVLGPAVNYDMEEHISWITIKRNIPSLIEELDGYDLAITGSGITPFEACAMGVPCITISSEEHEIQIAQYLERMGYTRYWGHRNDFHKVNLLDILRGFDVEVKSRRGIGEIPLNGIENVLFEIEKRMRK